ncbi:hypothetical protein [Paenibacillus polymyxa]|uniref:hypothetical protein n=1 Tax=Paenibacillus polymyxa TaxID=1406 RepID=UPI001118880E|nr:hypothetical protein [Paenibacillus polymyxa]QDA30274.1 hypothetical protein FGY93_25520 [Paenibacillus polymyxa]
MAVDQISVAYRAASQIDAETLHELPISSLKQARALMIRHIRNGHGAWEEPIQLLDEVIRTRAKQVR